MSVDGIEWRLHLHSPPDRVFATWATDRGRASFWVESSVERDGAMTLSFVGELCPLVCTILECDAPHQFAFTYFDGTHVEVQLAGDGGSGTDVTLRETGFTTTSHREQNWAGWVSVLMNLKAVVDHGIDLRNHDEARSWAAGFCEC